MKLTQLIYCLLFFHLNLILSGQTKDTPHFIPLKVGNYWIYSNSKSPYKYDTIKITEIKIIGSDTTYNYNGNLWMEKNDTIYEFQSAWTGDFFPTIAYFPSEKEVEYNISIGGDGMAQRTVTKIEGIYMSGGKSYTDCYKYKSNFSGGYIIISSGIGIIEYTSNGGISGLVEYYAK